MKQEVKSEKQIASIVALLTEDNKRYVIAVANALLYTQRRGNNDSQSCSKCTS